MAFRTPFGLPEARDLDFKNFKTIYHAALAASASCELAESDKPYHSWVGSHTEQGKLQFDFRSVVPSDLWDWKKLKTKLAKHGPRNSLLLAPMPTVSTSRFLGFNGCFESYNTHADVYYLQY